MSYFDGFVVPVPSKNKNAYKRMAAKAVPIFKEYGALRVVECWGDDVPKGKLTDFHMAVKLKLRETVVFSWIEWPNKKARDSGMKKAMQDKRLQPGAGGMPFDGKRMIYGGFAAIVDSKK